MKGKFGKIGILSLALVLALGSLGVGYAYWNETLTIDGTVATGELDVEFSEQWSNDDNDQDDPDVCGSWTFTGTPPSSATWNGTRYAHDVGKTICEPSQVGETDPNDGGMNQMTISVTNAYPCYHSSVAFTIDNIGTIPVHIDSIKLIEVSKGGAPTGYPNLDLVACTYTYYVDADDGTVSTTLDKAVHDFSIHLSELAVCQVIGVNGALPGDICIHVEEGAEELTTYDFTIEIVVEQFNAD